MSVSASTWSEAIRSAATLYPDRIAVVTDGTPWTYAEMDDYSTRAANLLLEEGLHPGDRVATMMYNDINHLMLLLGCAKAGLVLMPINRRLNPVELEQVLRIADPHLVVYDPEFADVSASFAGHTGRSLQRTMGGSALAEAIASRSSADPGIRVSSTDIQVIHFTSGTTGTPKGVCRTYASNMNVSLDTLAAIPQDENSVWAFEFSFTSASFWGIGAQVWLVGGTLRLSRKFDAPETLEALRTTVTHAALGPTMWEMLRQAAQSRPLDSKTLKAVFWGGMPIRRSAAERIVEWLDVPFGSVYGLTEAPCLTWNAGDDAREAPTAVGRPGRSTRIRLVDAQGKDLTDGGLGEILVKSDVAAGAYFNAPELTCETFGPDWLATGDMGEFDAAGRLHVLDRSKDVIISGGENIYPAEIEAVIGQLAEVQEVCALGVPDDRWGEVPAAIVRPVLGAEIAPEAILEHCTARLARYKIPKLVGVVGEIPKGDLGKFEKKKLLADLGSYLPSDMGIAT
jgi:fatty-acyl-CoA synthase